MSAKLSAAAACLLAGLCLCSFSWAQTANERFCAALDITSNCPTFSTSYDSSAAWLPIRKQDKAAAGSVGNTALRSGVITHSQRSCLGLTLQRPVRVAFRWHVSSEAGPDRLYYIDDGQRNFAVPGFAAGARFLSGGVAWRDESFEYPGRGPIMVEWCYVKNKSNNQGRDRGLLDQLRITQLPGNVIVSPSQVQLPEGGSTELTLALDETLESNVTVNLTVPEESTGDITVSINGIAFTSTQTVLSPDQPTVAIAIAASEDDNAEARERYVMRAQSPVAAATAVTITTPPDPLPQERLCEALDISEESCPAFSTSDDSSAIWLTSTPSGATGDMALRSGALGSEQRSCLRATLQRPVRVAFRWRVSSESGDDYLRYIDDGQRNPATPPLFVTTGDRFLSGEVAWREASFDYHGSGPVDIEWCYIKDVRNNDGDDAGFLDQLQITPLAGSVIVSPSQILLPEGGSTELILALDETLESNVTVNLTVPEESTGDITVSINGIAFTSTQTVLSPDQSTVAITITASEDDNAEVGETHIVRAQGPVAAAAVITVITPPDPLPNDSLCEALDITSDCPTFLTVDDKLWSTTTTGGATGGKALRSGAIANRQKSCLSLTLQRPVRVAFRWRVSSDAAFDFLEYDDGQFDFSRRGRSVEGEYFLSGDVAWKDASFDYFGRGPIDVAWCYKKDRAFDEGDDAGFLDRLQITPLPGNIVITPSEVLLPEGSSATLTLALDETPPSNVTVNLTVPAESADDITISFAQVILSPDQPDTQLIITASEDDNVELMEIHVVRAQSLVAGESSVTVITPFDPPTQAQLCAALDIGEEECSTFSISNDDSALWLASTINGAVGNRALLAGAIAHNRRSCLSATLQGPTRVAFRWRVSSRGGSDYLHYIDDGQLPSARPIGVSADRFLSGNVAWRDASFDYPDSGDIDIAWCYVKGGETWVARVTNSGALVAPLTTVGREIRRSGDDTGFLDQLQVTPLLGKLLITPSEVLLREGSSATLTLALDEAPSSNVTVNLTVPDKSVNDITISFAQVTLTPDQPATQLIITASEDDNVEAREIHVVRAQSPVAGETMFTAITPPDPLPQISLCEALDISEDCPTFSTSGDSSAVWLVYEDGAAAGRDALRSRAISHNQRSCLGTTLSGPVRVAFRWRVSSEARFDFLRYIDDGQRSFVRAPTVVTGEKFLSGRTTPWKDTFFDYLNSDAIDIEWCYIKDRGNSRGLDRGYLDQLQITQLPNEIIITPSELPLSEGSSATLILSLDKVPPPGMIVNLIVPTESTGDITVSSTQVVLGPEQSTMSIVITANKDNNVELRETHVVRVQSPVVRAAAMITVTTPPDPLPQPPLCEALDISEEKCPLLSTSDDSSAIWSASTVSGAIGGKALRNGMTGDNQRSCIRTTLQRPVRVAFRWRVSSQEGADYLHYIDSGQRSPVTGGDATGDKFLSGNTAWRNASFDHSGSGDIGIEWCYIKDGSGSDGDDAGFLDRLQVTQLLGSLATTPVEVQLPEGSSATFTLSLDKTPPSNVTVNLTVPTESTGDITVSPEQVVLSPSQPTVTFTVTVSADENAEARETHVVRAQSLVAAAAMITVTTPPDPLPQASLCAALDISEEDCPKFTFTTSPDSSAIWSASADSDAVEGMALRSEMIGDSQRSCIRAATLQGPVRVAFRWRVSSQEGADYLRYIDDSQRSPVTEGVAAGDKFLSGNVAWRDASFDYLGDGDIDIEWCYIKDGSGSDGDDAGFLDRLQVTPLLGSLVVMPAEVQLSEGGSAELTIALDETLTSNVTVSLTVPTESTGDITVSPAQAVLTPSRPAVTFTVTASEDDNAESRETHVVRAQSPVAAATLITVITFPDPPPRAALCEALDISEEDCPKFTFTTSPDSSAIWSASTVSGAIGDKALRSGMIGDNQRSCLRATLQRPVSVAFRWRVSSQARLDRLHYIDDGQRNPAEPAVATTSARFLSGDVNEWRDSDSFEYLDRGDIEIEWCYIKDGSGSDGDDAGFLDWLRITSLSSSINLKVRVYLEGALQ